MCDKRWDFDTLFMLFEADVRWYPEGEEPPVFQDRLKENLLGPRDSEPTATYAQRESGRAYRRTRHCGNYSGVFTRSPKYKLDATHLLPEVRGCVQLGIGAQRETCGDLMWLTWRPHGGAGEEKKQALAMGRCS